LTIILFLISDTQAQALSSISYPSPCLNQNEPNLVSTEHFSQTINNIDRAATSLFDESLKENQGAEKFYDD
jgi:hypothetical protein